jgi:predicted DNA-binding transcriptional regulator AlpA
MTDNGGQLVPLLVDIEGLAKLLGVSRSHAYALHSSGRLGPLPVKLGKCSRWWREEVESWIASGCPPRQKWQAMKDAG